MGSIDRDIFIATFRKDRKMVRYWWDELQLSRRCGDAARIDSAERAYADWRSATIQEVRNFRKYGHSSSKIWKGDRE